VEISGIESLTSLMPFKRSPELSVKYPHIGFFEVFPHWTDTKFPFACILTTMNPSVKSER